MTKLRTIVFVSQAAEPMSEEEIRSISEHSQKNNTRDDVTSVLLMCNGHYLEILEGPSDVLDATLERISSDPRHKELEVLIDTPIDFRSFDGASMAILHADNDDEICLTGLREIARRAQLEPEIAGEIAFALIEKFYNEHTRRAA